MTALSLEEGQWISAHRWRKVERTEKTSELIKPGREVYGVATRLLKGLIDSGFGLNKTALQPVFFCFPQLLSRFTEHLGLKYRPVCILCCSVKHLLRCISYFTGT